MSNILAINQLVLTEILRCLQLNPILAIITDEFVVTPQSG
jgi:hypothetical protein